LASESWLDLDLAFIVDPKLRGILEQFHRAAREAYSQKLYVAAVFLSGSVLEGLLTFALLRQESSARERFRQLQPGSGPAPRIDVWSLHDLIEISVLLGIVGEGPARGAQAIRDFRNLIHPYRLLRRSTPRWDALAAIALASVTEVSRSVQSRMAP
jgi:hypothetical protein